MKWLIEKYESGETLKFIFFWGHARNPDEKAGKFCLSQWDESPFTVDDVTYRTSEHWMMAQKALLFEDKQIYQEIIESVKPAQAKELGRMIRGFDDQKWNEHKYDIVRLGNIHKFNQNPRYTDYLLQTGNRIIVEASPVDPVWGIGMAADHDRIKDIHAWRGQNLLGFALMEVRDILKELGNFETDTNHMMAPWLQFPGIKTMDMFWRMGRGEEYLSQFYQFFEKLPERDKQIYKLLHPAQYDWPGFYD